METEKQVVNIANKPTKKTPRIIIVFVILFLSSLVGLYCYGLSTTSKEYKTWDKAIQSLTEEEKYSCDILKVSGVERLYNPKGYELKVKSYVTDSIFSSETLEYTTITLNSSEVKTPNIKYSDYIKACTDAKGFFNKIEVVDIFK